MIDWLQHVVAWVSGHPGLTLIVLFLCCFAESMVVIGMLIPAAVVLMPAGGLVALGSLDFWVTLVVAVAGAALGDCINYWVGYSWGERALSTRYAQRYEEPIARSRLLFERHRVKAVIFARFIGLIRPFIAAIAGAYRMPLALYLLIDVTAGVVWAGSLLAVGVVFGASLDLAAEVAARLAVLLVGLMAALLLLFWAVHGAVRGLQHRARDWLSATLDWSRRHRTVGQLGTWLADPGQPETPALALLALALLLLGWVWLSLWWGHGHHAGMFDMLAWQGAHDLRTPVTTALALGIAQLADWQVYGPVALTILLALLLPGRSQAAAHWVAAVAFGAALSLGLYLLLKVPDPINYFHGRVDVRFAGRDLVLATVIYAFVPVLLATDRPRSIRTLYYGVAAGLVGLMLGAEVYLGTVWLSTGLFAVVFGALWVTLLGIGYRRHGAQVIPAREVLPLAFGVLIAAMALQTPAELRRDVDAPIRDELHALAPATWWSTGYAELPAYRDDTASADRQPLTVQWRGDLGKIELALRAAGWEAPEPLTWQNSLRWLAVSAPLAQLPILPQLHHGRHQILILRHARGDDEQWVIRLWPSGWTAGRLPLWVGTLTRQTGRRAMRLVRYPQTEHDYQAALDALAHAPPGFEARSVKHPQRNAADSAWDGSLWLLRPAS